jgi:hypothetical protein
MQQAPRRKSSSRKRKKHPHGIEIQPDRFIFRSAATKMLDIATVSLQI